jgi:hypothetical protein
MKVLPVTLQFGYILRSSMTVSYLLTLRQGPYSTRLLLGQPLRALSLSSSSPSNPNCFAQGLHFKLIQPSDLLLVDHKGKILEESGQKDGPFRILNTAAFMIHSAIHTARPDVLCAAHSHSTYGKAFSALGKTLDPISQDACAFYNVRSRVACPPPLV